jgi:N-methylhydantoinase B/oxoprolinase/acetone carboxylase alpha subunit
MMDEFGIDDLEGLSGPYPRHVPRKATRAAIAAVPDGVYRNEMRVDGYDAPVDMVVTLTVEGDRLTADFAGTSGPSPFGVNVPEVYTRAYACFALKCTIAPEVPNNAGSLDPFEITAPEGSILAARGPRRSRSAMSSAIWCPTWCWARCTTRCPKRFPLKGPRRCGTSRSRCGPWTGTARARRS